MSENLEDLRKELEKLSSEELIRILRNRDEQEWRPEVFEIVASLLKGRGVSPEGVAALGPEGFDVVESAPTVTVAHFFSPAQAQASRMALEGLGIAAWVADDAGGTIYGVGIGSRLQVRAEDEAAAREVLSAAPVSSEDLPPELAEPPCPACGSRNVAPEAWVVPKGSGEPRGQTGRKWYYVCAACREAWPV